MYFATIGSIYSHGTLHSFRSEKIKVHIYPDLKTFHNAIFLSNAPDWVVGAAGKNELKMVTPLNPGSAHTYKSLMQAIVHELAHTVVLNVREQGQAGLPKWLNEGYAFYEANQMTDDMRNSIKSNLTKHAPPSWNQLDKAGTIEFGDMGGYALSTSIIEFLVNSYGFDKLIKLILAPERLQDIYGKSKEDLEIMWVKYLRGI